MPSNITSMVLAATESGGSSSDEGGNFLVTPELGLMLWTLIALA